MRSCLSFGLLGFALPIGWLVEVDAGSEKATFEKNTGKKILVSKDIILKMPAEHKPLFNIFSFLFSKIYKHFYILKKIKLTK